MTFISSSIITRNITTILFITMIINEYVISIISFITKTWTIIRITINSILTFFSLHILSRFYSMRILQSKDECFIIIFSTYWLSLYHNLYRIHSRTELYNLQRSSLHYSLSLSTLVLYHHNIHERILMYSYVLRLYMAISIVISSNPFFQVRIIFTIL